MQFDDKNDCNREIVTIDDITTALRLIENKEIIEHLKEVYQGKETLIIGFASEAYYELVYRKLGVLSLCDKKNNEHLWEKIAKDNGFCIAFNHNKWKFHSTLYSISYEEKLPSLTTSKTDFSTALLVQLMVKLKDFEKEQEWRMIIPNPKGEDFESFGKYRNIPMQHYHNRHFYYSHESVDSIVLGHQFFGDVIRIVNKTEYRVNYKEASAITRILDFLISVQYKVYWRNVADFGEYTYIPIIILCLHDYCYRIIVVSESTRNKIEKQK